MRIYRSTPPASFTQISNETLRDERLSYTARGVLCEILSRPSDWAETADAIAARARRDRGKAGEGRRVLRAAFAELQACGYLKRVRGRGGRGRMTTEVHIYDRPQTGVPDGGMSVPPGETGIPAGRTDGHPSGTSVGGTGVPDAGTSVRPGQTGQTGTDEHTGGTPVPPGQTDVSAGRTDVPRIGRRSTGTPVGGTSLRTLTTNTDTRSSARKRAGAGDEDLAFAEFWAVYPRKVGKQGALRKWRSVVRGGADVAEILAGAKRYRDDPERIRGGPRFTAHPATWLNDGRWADEPPADTEEASSWMC